MSTKSIQREELDAIHHFIRLAIYDFHKMNCQSHELIICLPNWLQRIMRYYPMTIGVTLEQSQDLNFSRFYDIEVQPHFKNEVVLFFKEYHINPDYFTPAIHVISFEDEENRKQPKN